MKFFQLLLCLQISGCSSFLSNSNGYHDVIKNKDSVQASTDKTLKEINWCEDQNGSIVFNEKIATNGYCVIESNYKKTFLEFLNNATKLGINILYPNRNIGL